MRAAVIVAAVSLLVCWLGLSRAAAAGPHCHIDLKGPVKTIVAGAQLQRLEAEAVGCGGVELGHLTGIRSASSSDPTKDEGHASVQKLGAKTYLVLEQLTLTETATEVDWELRDGTDVRATVRARSVVIRPSTGPARIFYDDEKLSTQQSGKSRLSGADPIAVAGLWTHNVRTIDVGDGIPRRSIYKDPVARIDFDLQWQLRSDSWTDVLFDDCNGSLMNGGPGCATESIDQIGFRQAKPTSSPLVVRLDLVQDAKLTILQTNVVMAARAETESIPYPVQLYASLECDNGASPVALKHNDVESLLNQKVSSNACRIVVRVPKNIPLSELASYGPQWFVVRIHQDGTEESKDAVSNVSFGFDSLFASEVAKDPAKESHTNSLASVWLRGGGRSLVSTSPAEKLTANSTASNPCKKTAQDDGPLMCFVETPIQFPALPTSGEGIYIVSIKPKPQSDGFTLRDAADSGRERIEERATFKAQLRLRGPFGFGSGIRMFVTVPLNVIGVRFPASPKDLVRSSQSSLYQPVTLVAGVAVAIEPWNYANAHNSWTVPLRFSAGLNFLDLTERDFAPAIAVGAAAAFQVIDGPPSVSSSIVLGAYYENDLREQHPLESGHRLLLTLGLNIFSLLSPDTKPAKQ